MLGCSLGSEKRLPELKWLRFVCSVAPLQSEHLPHLPGSEPQISPLVAGFTTMVEPRAVGIAAVTTRRSAVGEPTKPTQLNSSTLSF